MKDHFLLPLPYLHKQRSVLRNLQPNFAKIFSVNSYSRNHLSCSEISVPSAVTLFQSPTDLPYHHGKWGMRKQPLHREGQDCKRNLCALRHRTEGQRVVVWLIWKDGAVSKKVNLISRKKLLFQSLPYIVLRDLNLVPSLGKILRPKRQRIISSDEDMK